MPGRGVLPAGEPAVQVMGVLNVTPDSFSDGGAWVAADDAIARGRELAAQGATIVDVGGESTRPGAAPVDPAEEQRRVLRVVSALADEGIPVSIDTIHAATARAAVRAGASFINDVSGGLHDPGMLAFAAEASAAHGTRFIAGHWRGIPDPANGRSDYGDVVADVRDALSAIARDALSAGIDPQHLILDPGLGFDKTGPQCWEIIARLPELADLGFPVLVGASRKRMIADALAGLPEAALGSRADAAVAGAAPRSVPPHERDLATAVVSAIAARAGAWGVRVHEVAGTVQALAVEHARAAAAPATEPGSAVAGHSSALAAAAEPDPGNPNADRITLTGLEVFAHHGVFDFERERGQRFVVDAEVAVDLRAAAAGDALERTVHYGELAEAIVAAVKRDPVDLIETVAERVAEVALGFSGVRSARITVHKPDAPIAAEFADVSVTVERSREARGARP